MTDAGKQPSGRTQDLTAIFECHQARLLRRVESRIGMNPFADFSAEDVLQEAFADAYRGFDGLRSTEPAVVGAWLNKIVDNRLAQTMRDRSRAKRGGPIWQNAAANSSIRKLADDLEDMATETGSDRFLKDEIRIAIGSAIESLPDQQRTLVEQYYLAQQSLDEIAAATGMTKPAVRSLLYRAKAALKKELGNSSRWYTTK